MDTGTHLQAIWRRRWWVLAGALEIGLLVLLVRAAAAPTYTADATLFLVPGDQAGDREPAEIDRLTVAYGELVNDPALPDEIVARAELPLTEPEVRRRVDVTSPDDGQLVVSAVYGSEAGATQLANATAQALVAAADQQQEQIQLRELAPLLSEIENLEQQLGEAADPTQRALLTEQLARVEQARITALATPRTRLDIVRPARPGDVVHEPDPVREALLAFLLTFIVLAELAALLAARRGGIEADDPIPVVQKWTRAPVFRIGHSRQGPDESFGAMRFLSAERASTSLNVLLAPLGPGPGTDRALRVLLEAAAALDEPVTWLDLRSGAETADPADRPVGIHRLAPADRNEYDVVVRSLSGLTLVSVDAWESPELLLVVDDDPTLVCALLLDAATARKVELIEAERVLGYAGVVPHAVLAVDRVSRRQTRKQARKAVAPTRTSSPDPAPTTAPASA